MNRPEPDETYSHDPIKKGRCPECGEEDDVFTIEAENGAPPIPHPSKAACGQCNYHGDPIAFGHEWEWERMSEAEREEAMDHQERMEDAMAEAQYDAHHISMEREP